MKYISIDVESDGPCPGLYSMVCFGAIVVEPGLQNRFYGTTAPLTNANFIPEALAVSGFTREQHLNFPSNHIVMFSFVEWLDSIGDRVTMVSDNPAFDWQFINYYLHKYCGRNPLGFSARRIGDIYCGLVNDLRANQKWKRKYRKTKHDHNPLNDAKGNAEALLAMADEFKLQL